MLRVLDLFAGIGGFSLGLERTGGFETVAFCEIEPYAQKVLAKHWPGVPIYDDVRRVTADRLIRDGIGVDVITGGFPCQDISVAGKGAGIDDGTRSGLWSECARLIGELRPRYAIFENVTNLLNGERGAWFKRVLWDISQVGYDAEWHCIPASELGAHHHRDRVWILAYPRCKGVQQRWRDTNAVEESELAGGVYGHGISSLKEPESEILADPNSERGCGWATHWQDARDAWESSWDSWHHPERMGIWDAEPSVGRVANGVPKRSHRLRCLGNAVVPPIPELIGRSILGAEHAIK